MVADSGSRWYLQFFSKIRAAFRELGSHLEHKKRGEKCQIAIIIDDTPPAKLQMWLEHGGVNLWLTAGQQTVASEWISDSVSMSEGGTPHMQD